MKCNEVRKTKANKGRNERKAKEETKTNQQINKEK